MKKIRTIICVLALGGCAVDARHETGNESAGRGTAIEQGSRNDLSVRAEGSQVALYLGAEGAADSQPITGLQVCHYGFEAPRGYAAGSLETLTFPKIGGIGDCATTDADGLAISELNASSEILLEATSSEHGAYLLQITTSERNQDVSLRLPSRVQIDAAYAAAGAKRDATSASVIVEIAQADTEVSLVSPASNAALQAVYLDPHAEPARHAVAGGFALFTNVPEGSHDVRVMHASRACTASDLGWDTGAGRSAWASHGLTTYLTAATCGK